MEFFDLEYGDYIVVRLTETVPEALQETVPELLQFSQDQESMNLEASEELSVADLKSDPQDGLGEGWTVASAIYPELPSS